MSLFKKGVVVEGGVMIQESFVVLAFEKQFRRERKKRMVLIRTVDSGRTSSRLATKGQCITPSVI